MRKILLLTVILMANVLTMSAAKKAVITKIEPTDWYVARTHRLRADCKYR